MCCSAGAGGSCGRYGSRRQGAARSAMLAVAGLQQLTLKATLPVWGSSRALPASPNLRCCCPSPSHQALLPFAAVKACIQVAVLQGDGHPDLQSQCCKQVSDRCLSWVHAMIDGHMWACRMAPSEPPSPASCLPLHPALQPSPAARPCRLQVRAALAEAVALAPSLGFGSGQDVMQNAAAATNPFWRACVIGAAPAAAQRGLRRPVPTATPGPRGCSRACS